jgi:putative oxidoreductase
MTWLSRFAPQLQSLLRFIFGLMFIEHGTQKLIGFPPLPVEMAHMHVPDQFKPVLLAAAVIELVTGLLMTIGFFSRWAAFIASGEMAAAYFLGHVMARGSIFPATNAGDAAVLYCFIFLYFAAAGPGPIAVNQK